MRDGKTTGPAAMSFFVFGLYMTVLGIALVLAPNPLLSLVGIAETTEVWVRVVGVLVVVIGILDVLIAQADLRVVMRWGIYLRSGAAASLVAFAAADLVEPGILIFAAVDALSVAWAVLALRAEAPNETG
jgi:hypothetical protein